MLRLEFNLDNVKDNKSAGIELSAVVKENSNIKDINILLSKDFLEHIRNDEINRLNDLPQDDNIDALIQDQTKKTLKEILSTNLSHIEASCEEKLRQKQKTKIEEIPDNCILEETDINIFRGLKP